MEAIRRGDAFRLLPDVCYGTTIRAVDLACSVCGREAPPLGSRELVFLWRGGDASMVIDDPLMMDDVVCPECQPAGERDRRAAEYAAAE